MLVQENGGFSLPDVPELFGREEEVLVDADDVQLEIAERAFTNDPAKMLDVVRDLRAHHFAILLDGYGSGHSSLNLLKDDYFDVLKLDMRVLRDSTVDDRAERILRLVAQMAEILKLKIIALA